ncbi:MAG: pitrilysin family protein [Alphaproteobacteria bacterium]
MSPIGRIRALGALAFLACAALALAAPRPAGAETGKGVFQPETFTLANGLQVVVITNRRAPVVLHMMWYKVGAADEPPGKSGIAHFLEHLMFKGTKALPSGMFSKIVANNGGQENALTSSDYTAYYQSVARDRLETVMKIEADRMVNLELPEKEVESERKVILEERRQRTDNSPRSILWEQANAALYLNHPYRIPTIGWQHEMEGLTKADAMAFYRRWYAPNNAVLVVAGDVTAADVRPLAEKYYGVIERRDVPERARPLEPPHRHARRVTYKDSRVDQPNWSKLFIAPSYNRGETKHVYALQVLAEILGGGATSRLYQEIVVKQKLAASAGAGYSASNFDYSNFYVYAAPRTGVDIDLVEKAVEAAIAELLEKGVTADELARAKQVMIDRAAFAHDNLRTGVMSLGVALSTGRSVADVEAWPERIGKVTAEDVLAAAQHVLKDTGSVTALLLGTDKKAAVRKAAVAPGSVPADAPDDTDAPGEAPGAGQPN